MSNRERQTNRERERERERERDWQIDNQTNRREGGGDRYTRRERMNE